MRFYSICLGAIAYCECYKKIKHTLFVIHGCPLSLCNSLFSVFRDELKKKIIIKENDDVLILVVFFLFRLFFFTLFSSLLEFSTQIHSIQVNVVCGKSPKKRIKKEQKKRVN